MAFWLRCSCRSLLHRQKRRLAILYRILYWKRSSSGLMHTRRKSFRDLPLTTLTPQSISNHSLSQSKVLTKSAHRAESFSTNTKLEASSAYRQWLPSTKFSNWFSPSRKNPKLVIVHRSILWFKTSSSLFLSTWRSAAPIHTWESGRKLNHIFLGLSWSLTCLKKFPSTSVLLNCHHCIQNMKTSRISKRRFWLLSITWNSWSMISMILFIPNSCRRSNATCPVRSGLKRLI